MNAKKAEHDVPVIPQLLAMDTQIGIGQRIPPEMQLKDVALKVLSKLHLTSRSQLGDFKSRGGSFPRVASIG